MEIRTRNGTYHVENGDFVGFSYSTGLLGMFSRRVSGEVSRLDETSIWIEDPVFHNMKGYKLSRIKELCNYSSGS